MKNMTKTKKAVWLTALVLIIFWTPLPKPGESFSKELGISLFHSKKIRAKLSARSFFTSNFIPNIITVTTTWTFFIQWHEMMNTATFDFQNRDGQQLVSSVQIIQHFSQENNKPSLSCKIESMCIFAENVWNTHCFQCPFQLKLHPSNIQTIVVSFFRQMLHFWTFLQSSFVRNSFIIA